MSGGSPAAAGRAVAAAAGGPSPVSATVHPDGPRPAVPPGGPAATAAGRPGRRPGPSQTRDAVLGAARRLFSELGYDKTTIRAIGRAAGVDAALVHHFFGTKEQVFVAAMAFPFDPADMIPQLLTGPRDQLAQRLARFFLSVWRDPASRVPFIAVLRSASTNEQAAAMFREFIGSAFVRRFADALDLPESQVEAAVAQLVGLALLRYVIGIEPLASASEEEIVALVTPALAHYLRPGTDRPGPPDPTRPC
jgi:AcrR family transcriptional regulator